MKRMIYKNKDWLYEQYWDEEKTLKQVGEMCGVDGVTIFNWMKKFDINRRVGVTRFQVGHQLNTDENHPVWKGGGRSYHQKRARKIWEKHCNYKIRKGFIIHHRDRDYTNNDVENLVLLTRGLP